MNKQMKLQLENVIDAIIEGDSSAAKASFHEYLRAKTQSILIGESEDEMCEECKKMECECDEEKEDKKADKKVDKDLDKLDKDVKKVKKDQKKDDEGDE